MLPLRVLSFESGGFFFPADIVLLNRNELVCMEFEITLNKQMK